MDHWTPAWSMPCLATPRTETTGRNWLPTFFRASFKFAHLCPGWRRRRRSAGTSVRIWFARRSARCCWAAESWGPCVRCARRSAARTSRLGPSAPRRRRAAAAAAPRPRALPGKRRLSVKHQCCQKATPDHKQALQVFTKSLCAWPVCPSEKKNFCHQQQTLALSEWTDNGWTEPRSYLPY